MNCIKLGEISEFVMGQAPKSCECNKNGEGTVFVKAGQFGREYPIVQEWTTKPLKLARKNDVLICVVGATVGKLNLGIDCAIGRSVAAIRCQQDKLYYKYLYYYLSTWVSKIRELSQGSTIGVISKEMLYDLKIPNYDITIQKNISQVLDKAQELIDKRKNQINELDLLIKSKFIDMFGDPILNPKGWNKQIMNDVAPVVNYKGKFNEEKIWLLNLDRVESNTGKIIDFNYVSIDDIGNSTCTFDTTNVLYSKLRPYLNKVVIPKEIGYATSEMVPLQPIKGTLNRYYLTYMLRSKAFVEYISEKVAGAKMPRVSMNDFRSFEVAIPPIELQIQFENFVKQVDKLKVEMEQSLKKLEDNFNSLMQKAFKGELFI
ncbi:restriction endonuclease subunit S [Clostridium perfringens]|uniref:restriction endonuclease subunit S n=1 Tax=Clostridium perfringens TaxID=1502 RepID=UPI0039EAF84C